MTLNLKGKVLDFDEPKVMGILNITPDSFFEASRFTSSDEICRRVDQIMEEGADIIDIGGYSTRPGAEVVSEEEEFSRLSLGLQAVRQRWPNAIVSIDTFRSSVAEKCITEWDVDIINDVSGGTLDARIWDVVAENNVAYILMHMRGTPATMSLMTNYDDVTADVLTSLSRSITSLREKGVANVIVDPGFGFAKTVEQNYALLNGLEAFKMLDAPILVGVSRKSMIYKYLDIKPEESLTGTVALNTIALMKQADILRVHDVKAAKQAVELYKMTISS